MRDYGLEINISFKVVCKRLLSTNNTNVAFYQATRVRKSKSKFNFTLYLVSIIKIICKKLIFGLRSKKNSIDWKVIHFVHYYDILVKL
jgi:predicted membrane protein